MSRLSGSPASLPFKTRSGWRRPLRTIVFAWRGLRSAWRHEESFRQESVIAAVLAPLVPWLGRSWVERCVLVAAILLVLAVELVNSAIEAAVDRISPEPHPLAARAKDMASAAVLCALLLCGGIWLSLLLVRLHQVLAG